MNARWRIPCWTCRIPCCSPARSSGPLGPTQHLSVQSTDASLPSALVDGPRAACHCVLIMRLFHEPTPISIPAFPAPLPRADVDEGTHQARGPRNVIQREQSPECSALANWDTAKSPIEVAQRLARQFSAGATGIPCAQPFPPLARPRPVIGSAEARDGLAYSWWSAVDLPIWTILDDERRRCAAAAARHRGGGVPDSGARESHVDRQTQPLKQRVGPVPAGWLTISKAAVGSRFKRTLFASSTHILSLTVFSFGGDWRGPPA